MIMKIRPFKVSFLGLLCALVLVLSSCSENKLKMAVKSGNKECPISIGLGGELTNMYYEDNTVKFLFSIEEQFIDIDKLNGDSETMKTTVMASLRSEKARKMTDMVIDAGADLRIIYKGKTSGKTAELLLSAEELKTELEKPEPSPEEMLGFMITQTNQQMPLDTGTGVIITELVEKGDTVIYMSYVQDVELLKLMARNKNDVKGNQRIMFKMMQSAEREFFKILVKAGKDLGYIYYADGTDETIEVVHTNSELQEIFQ